MPVRAPSFRWIVILVSERDVPSDAVDLVCDRVQAFGHRVLEDLIVPPDHDELAGTLGLFARDTEVDIVLTLGATGPGLRDLAPEAAAGRIGKELPGFGERFRVLAEDVLGPTVWAERVRGATLPAPDAIKLLFQLPDHADACDLALSDLVLPGIEPLFARANPNMDLEERFHDEGRADSRDRDLDGRRDS